MMKRLFCFNKVFALALVFVLSLGVASAFAEIS